jgi:hypothetical protein
MTDNIEECFNVLIFHFIVETSHLVLGLSQWKGLLFLEVWVPNFLLFLSVRS